MLVNLLRKKVNDFHGQGSRRSPLYLFSLALLLVSLNLRSTGWVSLFQAESQWSPVQTIPMYHPETWPPILVADQNRTVHAFSYQWTENPGVEPVRAILYNKWTLEKGWTNPVDILISPVKEARLTDVLLDENGIFHLTFFGGDNTYADIYYSKAPAERVGEASAWSMPVIIGVNAGDPQAAVFAEDNQGTLFVIYSSRQAGNSLYVVSSTNGGELWSLPTPIYFTQNYAPYISELEVIRSKSGLLHGIWAVNNDAGQGRGIYYTRSENGNKWSEPILLAEGQEGELGTQVPTIFEYEDILFAIYITQAGEANKMVMRQSRDGGITWSEQSLMFPRHVGVNGTVSLVTDGNNELHLFFGQRIPGSQSEAVHGVWHSFFENNRWTEPEGIVRGYKVLDKEGYSSFDPNSPRAIVSQGNVILVTWRTDPGSKGNGVWFSYKRIDAPERPVVPLPTSSTTAVSPLESPESTLVEGLPAITPASTNRPLNNELFESPSSSINVGVIFEGIAVVISLFLVAFLLFVRKR